jgi:hypothetical protein
MPSEDESKSKLLHVPGKFWRRIERLRKRIVDRLPAGVDKPSLQMVARQSLDLGIHSLGRQLSKEEKEQAAPEKQPEA